MANHNKNIWIFQASPKRFKILDALSDPEYAWDNWKIKQHKNVIKKGDLALIWISGDKAGIYATGDIISNPFCTDKYNVIADKYFLNNKEGRKEIEESKNKSILKATIKYTKILKAPLYKQEFKRIFGLENLSILKMPRGTNFKVTPKEWVKLSKLI